MLAGARSMARSMKPAAKGMIGAITFLTMPSENSKPVESSRSSSDEAGIGPHSEPSKLSTMTLRYLGRYCFRNWSATRRPREWAAKMATRVRGFSSPNSASRIVCTSDASALKPKSALALCRDGEVDHPIPRGSYRQVRVKSRASPSWRYWYESDVWPKPLTTSAIAPWRTSPWHRYERHTPSAPHATEASPRSCPLIESAYASVLLES